MFKTNSTEGCGYLSRDGMMLDERCDFGFFECENCNGRVHCNSCLNLKIKGDSNVEILAYNVVDVVCYDGCNVTLNVYSIAHIACYKNCNMMINAFEAVTIDCYLNCTAIVRVPNDIKINCEGEGCNMTVEYHNSFSEFCLNSGLGLPVIPSTEVFFTTTARQTTNGDVPETTGFPPAEKLNEANTGTSIELTAFSCGGNYVMNIIVYTVYIIVVKIYLL